MNGIYIVGHSKDIFGFDSSNNVSPVHDLFSINAANSFEYAPSRYVRYGNITPSNVFIIIKKWDTQFSHSHRPCLEMQVLLYFIKTNTANVFDHTRVRQNHWMKRGCHISKSNNVFKLVYKDVLFLVGEQGIHKYIQFTAM